MAFDIQEWIASKISQEVIFEFQGEISSKDITLFLDEIEANITDTSSKVKKKIYNVLVECLQNLFHHSAILPDHLKYKEASKFALCMICRNDVGFHILTSNFVTPKQKGFLTKHLEYINTLDKDQLKSFYKEILDNQEFSEKGGGGLGMIDIARKSGSKLDFTFQPYKEEFDFFNLDINIIE
jgi:hypothetical protein